MRISLNWLQSFIDLKIPPFRLTEILDNIGLVVDDWEEIDGDVILEIETYANRPDTTGHLGIARELATALDLPFKKQTWPLTEVEKDNPGLFDIQISDEELCPRYCGIVVKGLEVGPSPDWLREKVEAMGLNSTNNVVDVTNYVLFATAQPIHAFDLAKLAGQRIVVRKAKKDESLVSLDGDTIKLSPENLVIADEKKPVALAGIIGGMEAAVSSETRDVLIESACFNPLSVRLTSKENGIKTDASYRFERGSDVSFPPRAALMAASLLTQLGGEVSGGIVDVYPKPRKNKSVVLRHHRITELLGVEIDADFVVKILTSLGFQVENQQQGIWQIKVPFFRVDVEREADLIEEIARFYGYDKIPSSVPPSTAFETIKNQKRKALNKLRQLLFHNGFDEVVNFGFSDPEKEAVFKTRKKGIEIRNPFSSKASLLRTTLIGGLVENIVWNKNRGLEGVHVFEIGNAYFWKDDKHREQLTLAMATTGSIDTNHLHEKNENTDFFLLKGACEVLMVHLRFEPFSFKVGSQSFFEQNNSLDMYFKGKKVGSLGLLKKEVLESYSLKDKVWAAELDLDALFEKQPRAFRYTPVAKYPRIIRDVTFIVDRDVIFQDVFDEVGKLKIPNLESFELYDRFEGAPVPKDKVSLSLRFVFRNPQRTLLAKEADKLQQKIISALCARFGFQLREGGEIDN